MLVMAKILVKILTYFILEIPKNVSVKQYKPSVDPDQMPHYAASDQGLHCCINYRNFYKTYM